MHLKFVIIDIFRVHHYVYLQHSAHSLVTQISIMDDYMYIPTRSLILKVMLTTFVMFQ